MQLTYYEWFCLEWATICRKLNPTSENKKQLAEIKKAIRERQKSSE